MFLVLVFLIRRGGAKRETYTQNTFTEKDNETDKRKDKQRQAQTDREAGRGGWGLEKDKETDSV